MSDRTAHAPSRPPGVTRHGGGVTLAFLGVNQIFQLALAAYEIGALDRLHCALIDAPGKWGRLAARILGSAALTNRRCPPLPGKLVSEYPWPFLAHAVLRRKPADWIKTNDAFDRHVAAGLGRGGSRVFVGVETCAERSLRAARQLGMRAVLDCPQVHPAFLHGVLARATDDLGLPPPPPVDIPAMAARKEAEFALADLLLTPSDVARESFVAQGFAEDRLKVVPLWADQELWFQQTPDGEAPARRTGGPLRALFVGRIELRKGVPYLLRAMRKCRGAVELSMVGMIDPGMKPFLEESREDHRYVPPMTKPELRRLYWDADVLVMPSLMDSFGFVAMEAMACGLPVIVSDHSGVPVPDPSWRVPIMDPDAIVARLMQYADDRELCREHGRVARQFVRDYRPEAYRTRIGEIIKTLLPDGE